MRNGFRLFFMGALGVAACSVAARGAEEPKKVQFESTDGVQLEGLFYPSDPTAGSKSKEATVLLLHNINAKTGGSSSQPGWDELAKTLQANGYAVLKFDFRGFGNSTNVDPTFWKQPYNIKYVRGANRPKPPATVSHKDFDNNASEYYPYLVNDIAAAKAYLDRRNDAGQANTSSLILIGAGEGATLGAMWMASEWHRQKVSSIDPATLKLNLEEPEGRDEAAAVWLNLSPKLGNRQITTTLHNWLAEMAGGNKVGMGFIYGAQDEASATAAKADLDAIANQVRRDNPGVTGEALKNLMIKKGVGSYVLKESKVTGSDLLTANNSDAQKWIVDKFLKSVMEERGAKENRKRDAKEDTFIWIFPGSKQPVEAKKKGEDNLHPVPVDKLLRPNG